jgi:TolB-like protein/tetratricopeptide (TPR) repeat protein
VRTRLRRGWNELTRRRVYRVAATYAGISVAIALAIAQVYEVLLLPDWAPRLVMVLLVVGFPIVLVLAWPDTAEDDDATTTASRGRPAPAAEGPIRSIAVLPLANLSGTPQEDYFADGFTDVLIADLARLNAFDVISRTSVMRFKSTTLPLPAIARELGVDAVIEGSVLRAGDEVRVTAQLIRGDSDTHLWAASFERRLENILSLQREIAQTIVREVRGTLTPAQQTRLGEPVPVVPDAHLAYLQGLHYRNQWTAESCRKGVEWFEEAIRRDPWHAPAHAELALTYSSWVFPAALGLSPKEVARKGREAALEALAMDEGSAVAHAALAMISFTWDWDWDEVGLQFQRALELNPNAASTLHLYSHFLLAMGRFEESLRVSRRALALDPLDAELNVHLAWHHHMAREPDRALHEAQRAVDADPSFHEVYWALGLAREGRGQLGKAAAAMEKAAEASVGVPFIVADLGHTYGRMGRADDARAILRALQSPSSSGRLAPHYGQALVHTGLGDADEAVAALERAFEERDPRLVYLATEPRFDPLRAHPRYPALVQRLGLDRVHNSHEAAPVGSE